jgi:hypothetical protein
MVQYIGNRYYDIYYSILNIYVYHYVEHNIYVYTVEI